MDHTAHARIHWISWGFLAIALSLGACDGDGAAEPKDARPEADLAVLDATPLDATPLDATPLDATPLDAALEDAAPDAGSAVTRLRFAHLAWDLAAVDLWLDGAPWVEDVATFAVSPAIEVSPGVHQVALVRAGGPLEEALAQADIELQPFVSHTVFSFGAQDPPGEGPGLSFTHEVASPDGFIRGRVLHAATGVGPVDVWLGTSVTPFSLHQTAVLPGGATELVEVDPMGPIRRGSLDLGFGAAAGPNLLRGQVSREFGAFTYVALVGDPRVGFSLVVFDEAGIERLVMSTGICVVHASAVGPVQLERCVEDHCEVIADGLRSRRVLCNDVVGGSLQAVLPSGERVGPVALDGVHFARNALIVLHDRNGRPELAWRPLGHGQTAGSQVRLMNLADGPGDLTFFAVYPDRRRALAPALALGEVVVVPLAGDPTEIQVETADGQVAQRLPLRVLDQDPSGAPDLEVVAMMHYDTLLLTAGLDNQPFTWMSGATPIGARCDDDPCAPEGLCVTVQDPWPTCRVADCLDGGCGLDELCVELAWRAPVCLPRVEVSGAFDVVLNEDPQSGEVRFVAEMGGASWVYDEAPTAQSRNFGRPMEPPQVTVSARRVTEDGDASAGLVLPFPLAVGDEVGHLYCAHFRGPVDVAISEAGYQPGERLTGTLSGYGPAVASIFHLE